MTRRVYFIKPVGLDGPIKIGCSLSPNNRRKTLDTWSPFALEVAAEIEGGHVIERQFHARHYEAHQRKEWFDATPLLLADIASINAGTFDVSVLPEPRRLPTTAGCKPGRKWTEQQREECRARNKHRRIEKKFGLVSPYQFSDPRNEEFFADPEGHGITHEERRRRWQLKNAQMRIEAIDKQRVEIIAGITLPLISKCRLRHGSRL